jgi:DNA-binding transcriptional MerR regulator
MQVGELAKRIGRSTDTIKRWEEAGLLTCERDGRGRRVYGEEHVKLGFRLADLGVSAQRRSEKLKTLADREPHQLSLLPSIDADRMTG